MHIGELGMRSTLGIIGLGFRVRCMDAYWRIGEEIYVRDAT